MQPTKKPATKRKTIFAAFLVITLAAGGCQKSSSTSSDTVTVDDAAEAVTEAVTPESAGMVAQTETTIVVVNNNSLSCGTESDTSFSGSSASGATISYSYAYSASSLLTCSESNLPAQFTFNFSGKTSYDAPRISSSDSSKGQFTVTGLEPSATQYVVSESYTRNGSETSKVRNHLSFTSTITITTTDLTIDKQTQQILSGTAQVLISGSATNGRSFSFSGTLSFNGNKQATLTLGNGNSYSISWS